LGNKADKEENRTISIEKAKAWCKANGDIPYFETSAKDQTNVKEAFEQSAQKAIENQKNIQPMPYLNYGKTHTLTTPTVKKDKCC